MASILDSVDAYQDLLATLWKDKYKEDLPEDVTLLLGELKFKIKDKPMIGEPIRDELLQIESDS